MSLRRLSVLRWLVAAGVTAGLGVLVAGALASGRAPAAGAAPELALGTRATLELVPVTRAECGAPRVLLGGACLDKSGMVIADKWTIGERSAQWAPGPPQAAGQWRTTYAWTVPQTIPPAGATLTLKLTAAELTKLPNARVCPGMGVRSSLTSSVDLGVCAPSGGTASDSKTVRLLPYTSSPGTSIYLSIGLQDGPGYTYKYRAVQEAAKVQGAAAASGEHSSGSGLHRHSGVQLHAEALPVQVRARLELAGSGDLGRQRRLLLQAAPELRWRVFSPGSGDDRARARAAGGRTSAPQDRANRRPPGGSGASLRGLCRGQVPRREAPERVRAGEGSGGELD